MPNPMGQRFSLPAWIPGSYMIREFSKNVVRLSAQTNGHSVDVHKIDKATWQCAPCETPLTLTYEVYAWDLSVRTAHLDTTHAYFNGTSVFLMPEGLDDQPCSVDILPPQGEAYKNWRVGTALPRLDAEIYGFGVYHAADYEELVDHPVEISDFKLAGFVAGGIPHDLIIHGRHRADMTRLTQDLKRICETHISLFGELPAMDRYVFLVMVVGEGYGGLEHRASTSLICKRDDLPRSGMKDTSEDYRTFLGLCSHEYFHTWNIKRIKPEVFLPYDLRRENYTRQLWAFEGITSYYDDLGLVRSGVITKGSYMELLGQTVTRVWRGEGRFKQSVADSSFDAWVKFYRQDENAPNAIVSYYTKGALIALALDMIIRRETNGEKSLDDVMRTLWMSYGKQGIGIPEGGVERIVEEVSGLDLNDFFSTYLYGTQDLPLDDLLSCVGVQFELRVADNANDQGGKPGKLTPEEAASRAVLGVRSGADNTGAKLANVFDDGAAQQTGLSAGDIIIAVDGIKTTKENLEKIIVSYGPGTTVKIHAFRRDELMEFEVTLKKAPLDTCVCTLKEVIEGELLSRRRAWLGS